MSGFIKLHRSIADWEWYDELPTLKLFIHLIIKANYEDKRWHGKVIKRGQMVTSLALLADSAGLSVQQTRTALKHLQDTGEITRTATSRYTVITVENYEKYQCRDNVVNTNSVGHLTSKQQTNNKQTTTTKEIEEFKEREEFTQKEKQAKEKGYGTVLVELPDELRESVEAFIEMRKKIKAPMTERALRMMLKKLNELSSGEMWKAIAILDQSTMNSWKGIYAIKERGVGGRNEVLDLIQGGAFDD